MSQVILIEWDGGTRHRYTTSAIKIHSPFNKLIIHNINTHFFLFINWLTNQLKLFIVKRYILYTQLL